MSADDRNDLPPLAAGAGRRGHDPDSDAFDRGTGPPKRETTPEKKKPEPAMSAKKEAPVERHHEFVGTGVFWGLVVAVALAIIVIVFAALNTQDATVKVFSWDWSSPLFVVILISLIIGIVLDEIVGLVYRSRRRRRLTEKAELKRLRGKR
jgi:uncharacterized integral membrane protein